MKLAQEYLSVDRLQGADSFGRFLLSGKTEDNWDWLPQGVVVFLGGDQFSAVRAGQILGYRVVVYVEHEPRWRLFVHAFGIRNPEIKKRYGAWWKSKMHLVGDLMVDGVASASHLQGLPIAGWGVGESVGGPPTLRAATPSPSVGATELLDETTPLETPPPSTLPPPLLPRGWQRFSSHQARDLSYPYQICILPGSKAAKLSLGVPLGLAIADELRQLLPNVNFVIPVAPTLTAKMLARYAQPNNPDLAIVHGTSAILERTSSGSQFVTPFGTVIQLWPYYPAYSVTACADLCITTVGANTAELARLGTPMIVLIPFNKLDAMRAWDGILGILANLPYIGTVFAKGINWIAIRSKKLWAWPNIWAGEEVVPELKGHLYPMAVAEAAFQLLQDRERCQKTRERLQTLGGKPGAAKALVNLIIDQLGKSPSLPPNKRG
jgi:lipid-A-disaccharide synthase